MAKLVGVGAVKKVKTYTEEEVKEVIETKIAESEAKVEELTNEKVELTAKVEELTKEVESLKTDKKTK